MLVVYACVIDIVVSIWVTCIAIGVTFVAVGFAISRLSSFSLCILLIKDVVLHLIDLEPLVAFALCSHLSVTVISSDLNLNGLQSFDSAQYFFVSNQEEERSATMFLFWPGATQGKLWQTWRGLLARAVIDIYIFRPGAKLPNNWRRLHGRSGFQCSLESHHPRPLWGQGRGGS